MTVKDFVLGDDDGGLFLPLGRASDIAETATAFLNTKHHQAATMQTGTSLLTRAHSIAILAAHDRDGTTFRQHLRSIGGEIEEQPRRSRGPHEP